MVFNANSHTGKLYFRCQTLSLLHVLGKKWTVDVIEVLSSHKKIQFNSFLQLLNGITPRALSKILNDLILAQIIEKTELRKKSATFTSYTLTKKGEVFEKFILSAKELGVNLYSIDASCVDKQCSTCSLNALENSH